MGTQSDFPQGYESYGFSVSPSACGIGCSPEGADWLSDLQFHVTEVWGSSGIVAPGERYVVRGKYILRGADPFAISLAVLGQAFGATAHVLPGESVFETSTEILELTGPNGQLGMVVGRGAKCQLTTWITLAGALPRSAHAGERSRSS